MAQGMGADVTGNEDKFGPNARNYSPAELIALTGAAAQSSSPEVSKQLGRALAAAISAALKETPIVVAADSNAIAKVASNAHIHSTRPGGRR